VVAAFAVGDWVMEIHDNPRNALIGSGGAAGRPSGPGQVERITGSPYVELPIGVRWLGWHGGHDLENTLQWGKGGWWCHADWIRRITPEELCLWLLAH